MFTNVSIGHGFDDDKTWFDYKDDVYENVNRFYEILPLPIKIRKDIYNLLKYSGSIIGRIIIPF